MENYQIFTKCELALLGSEGYERGSAICSNYRGVPLLSVPGKVFGNIIRLREGFEKKVCENQGSSRSGRGCAGNVICLRLLLGLSCVEFQLPALPIFVDLKAAFPSMWHTLSDYGIPEHYVRLICCTYETNCEAAILVEVRLHTGSETTLVFARVVFGLTAFWHSD